MSNVIDREFWKLPFKEKVLYMKGQKTFASRFYYKNNLERFTKNKTGKDYVQGVVARGRYLKQYHPIRSSCLNLIDFVLGIKHTIKTGTDPVGRKLLQIMKRSIGVK